MLDTQVLWLPVEAIAPNPAQPRRDFDPVPLSELADSIRRHGILQPLSVRRTEAGWELVAGERRLRAAKLAGLSSVPCLRVEAEADESALLALIENIQRRDLHYLEEAAAIAAYLRRSGATQEEAAARLGRSPGIMNLPHHVSPTPPPLPISCGCCGSPRNAAACWWKTASRSATPGRCCGWRTRRNGWTPFVT